MSKGNFVDRSIYGAHLNPGNKSAYNPQQEQQWLEERMYRRIISELAMARFKWEGLPPEIDPRHVETMLFRHALCVFTELSSDLYGRRFFALQGSGAGRIDPYDNPTKFTVTGNSYLNLTIERNKCVPIWANYMREPDWDVVQVFSYKLARISRSIDIAELNMRNTNIAYVTENAALSMQNIIRQRDQGDMTIYAKKGGAIEPGDIQAVDMKVHPDTLPKLMLAKSKLWNECMTLLGVNNANQDKAERVQAAEVSANDDQVGTMRRIALNAREQAVEEINKRYKLDVSVEFHTEAIAAELEQEELQNGDVYNAATSGGGAPE